jgi:hypothetical protein
MLHILYPRMAVPDQNISEVCKILSAFIHIQFMILLYTVDGLYTMNMNAFKIKLLRKSDFHLDAALTGQTKQPVCLPTTAHTYPLFSQSIIFNMNKILPQQELSYSVLTLIVMGYYFI